MLFLLKGERGPRYSVPLDHHAAMYISASRSAIHPPCLGLLQRFDTVIPRETLIKHCEDLVANPLGMGRRVVRSAVPGARDRWEPCRELPEWALRILREPVAYEDLQELIDDEISQQPDPLRNHGWRFTAVPTTDGGMLVINWTNHAYGDARSMIRSVFAPRDVWMADASAEPAPARTVLDDIADLRARLRTGLRGAAELARDVAAGPLGREREREQLRLLRPAVDALRSGRRPVGGMSSRRVVAMARVRHDHWREVANANNGSSNTLFLAMLGNLIRVSRRARGEADDRMLRLLMPVDIKDFVPPEMEATNTIVASVIPFEPGAPRYGDLTDVREATKIAIETAVSEHQLKAPNLPHGVIDAMHLLPNSITHRIAARVQASVDGVASNVGPIPEHIGRIGEHMASDMFLIATPSRTDVTGTFGRNGETSTLAFVADPALIGPAGSLRDRVAAEFAAWGITAEFPPAAPSDAAEESVVSDESASPACSPVLV
jgi:hypothetical protein